MPCCAYINVFLRSGTRLCCLPREAVCFAGERSKSFSPSQVLWNRVMGTPSTGWKGSLVPQVFCSRLKGTGLGSRLREWLATTFFWFYFHIHFLFTSDVICFARLCAVLGSTFLSIATAILFTGSR